MKELEQQAIRDQVRQMHEDRIALLDQVMPYCVCGMCKWNRERAEELRANADRLEQRGRQD